MPINRYQIRNVYSLADPDVYKTADKDDPEALLEGVAMAGLVGVLRQLGDLAESAAEIFHDLHEEVMATAARGHGLLVRVQQLELEIPSVERAFLSQTSHSAFFPNSGIDWHPNQQTTQNLITTGDLPRFVMDSYEECRGPPRLFLLDKFDVSGAGACLKRYTDPSIYKVEASSYDIGSAEIQWDKKTRKTKKKGSRWKRGEPLEVSQPSHVKLHQLFLEERVRTGATESARRVKLKKRPRKFPFDSESGKSYMNNFLNSPLNDNRVDEIPTPADTSNNESQLQIFEDNILSSTLCSPIQSTTPFVASSVNDKHMTMDDETITNCIQNGSDDVASVTDNYMDALATIDSEHETEAESGPKTTDHITYADANSDGNTSPVGIESPPPPFSCTRIPFRPRVPRKRRASIAENSQNMDLDITNDKCMDDLSKEPNVCLNHDEYFDSPKQSEESEHSDILQTAESLSSFSFIRNHNADVPNILDTNKVEYAKGNYSTDFVDSGCSSPYSQVNVEEPGDIDDIVAGETAYDSDRYSCLPEEELKEIEDGILHSTEARVFSYSSEDETGLNTPEIEPEPVASVVGCNDCGLPKEETDFEEREIESVNPHDVKINDGKVIKTFEDFKESEEKEGNGICSLKNHEDLKESGEKEGIGRFIVENRQDSTESEDKEGKGYFILENSEKEEGNGRVTLENREYSKNSIEKEGNGCFNRENRESEASEEEEGNGCFTVMEGEDSEESKEKGGNGCFTHPEDSEESEEEGHGRFTLENHEASKKSEETERNGCFTQHEDSEESEEADGRFTLENCEDPEKSEEKDGNGCFTNLEDSKESEEKERNGGFTPENGEDSEKSEEKEGNSSFTHRYDSENSEEKEEIGRFTPENDEDSEKSEEKEGNGCFTRRYDSEESEEREGNDCITLESRQHSENSEHKEGNGCSSLENHEDSMESDEKEGSFTHQYDSSESEEKEANGRSTLENHEDSENSLEKEGNDCFTVKNCEDSVESEGKEGNDCFPLENLEDSNESEEKEVNDCFTLENSKNSKESEEKERNDCFTLENLIDSEESEERDRIDHLNFTLENHKDTKESEEEGSGSFTPKTHEDAKNSGEKEEVDQVLGISPDDLNHNVYSLPDTTCDEGGDDNPSLNSKIIEDQISYFLPKTDQNQKSILYDLGPQPIDISACDHPIVEDNIDQTPNDQIDICEAKFDHPESHQLLVDSLTCIDHETPPINAQLQEIGHDFGKVKQHSSPVYSAFSLLPQIPPVKPEEMPPLPPLPPMQWRMRKLENSLFTPTDGQHTRSSFPPFFPSTPIEAPEATTHSIVKDGDRQSGNPFPSFFPSTPIEAPEVVSHSIVEDGCQQSDNPSPPYFPSTPIEAPEVVTQPIVEDCGQKSDNPSPPFFPSTPTEVPKVDTHSIVEDGGQQSDNPSPPYFPCTPIEAPEVVTQPIVEDCGQQSDNPSPPFFPSTPTEVPEVDTHSIVEDGGQHNDNPFPSFLTSTPIEALEAITHSIVEDEGQQNVPPFLPFFPSTSIEAPEVVTHSIVADCGQQSDNPSPPFFQSTPIEASEVDSHSIVEDGDQQSDSPFTPFSPSTPIKAPEVVTHMIVEDEIKNMDTEIYDDDENLVPKAAVESIQTASEQEVFLPSSHPPDVKEMQNTIQPMKIRPRSPLMDAVVAHDKTKLRKVSGQSTTQMSKRDERDAILDQIRAKSFNLKPPVQTRPSIQGPKTNLRVAAILEKANAIRQAFAGSDDEDDDSDSWSDS